MWNNRGRQEEIYNSRNDKRIQENGKTLASQTQAFSKPKETLIIEPQPFNERYQSPSEKNYLYSRNGIAISQPNLDDRSFENDVATEVDPSKKKKSLFQEIRKKFNQKDASVRVRNNKKNPYNKQQTPHSNTYYWEENNSNKVRPKSVYEEAITSFSSNLTPSSNVPAYSISTYNDRKRTSLSTFVPEEASPISKSSPRLLSSQLRSSKPVLRHIGTQTELSFEGLVMSARQEATNNMKLTLETANKQKNNATASTNNVHILSNKAANKPINEKNIVNHNNVQDKRTPEVNNSKASLLASSRPTIYSSDRPTDTGYLKNHNRDRNEKINQPETRQTSRSSLESGYGSQINGGSPDRHSEDSDLDNQLNSSTAHTKEKPKTFKEELESTLKRKNLRKQDKSDDYLQESTEDRKKQQQLNLLMYKEYAVVPTFQMPPPPQEIHQPRSSEQKSKVKTPTPPPRNKKTGNSKSLPLRHKYKINPDDLRSALMADIRNARTDKDFYIVGDTSSEDEESLESLKQKHRQASNLYSNVIDTPMPDYD